MCAIPYRIAGNLTRPEMKLNDKQRGSPVITARRSRKIRAGNNSLTGIVFKKDLVDRDDRRTSSEAETCALARHIIYLEAKLLEARRELHAAKIERETERDRAALLEVKLAPVVEQTRASAAQRPPSPPADHRMPAGVTPRAIAPDGNLLTATNLPSPDTRRWVPSRKAIVVAAVRAGILSIEEACGRYRLTKEELAMWQLQVERHGLAGLRTGKGQLYRHTWKRAPL